MNAEYSNYKIIVIRFARHFFLRIQIEPSKIVQYSILNRQKEFDSVTLFYIFNNEIVWENNYMWKYLEMYLHLFCYQDFQLLLII